MKNVLSQIARYNIRTARPIPDKSALIVIDMQRYFYSIASPIIKQILSLIEVCHRKGIQIYYTRHGHKRRDDGSMLSRWWGELILYGTEEWKLIEEMQADPVSIIDKERYNAFHETELDQQLRSKGIEDLLISGVMTNCCVETTARSGFDLDYRIFVVADGCATVNEELHLASLKNLAYGFAYIVDTKMAIECLENHGTL